MVLLLQTNLLSQEWDFLLVLQVPLWLEGWMVHLLNTAGVVIPIIIHLHLEAYHHHPQDIWVVLHILLGLSVKPSWTPLFLHLLLVDNTKALLVMEHIHHPLDNLMVFLHLRETMDHTVEDLLPLMVITVVLRTLVMLRGISTNLL